MNSQTPPSTQQQIEEIERIAWFARLAFGGDVVVNRPVAEKRAQSAGFQVMP